MSSDESEQYDFEYSDDDQSNNSDDNGELSTENLYYNAKGQRDDGNLDEAGEMLTSIVDGEVDEKTPFGFKSLKQLIKLYGRVETGDKEKMIQAYIKLLVYISEGAVTQNVSEKGINSILDRVSNNKEVSTLHRVYQETLKVFSVGGTSNERLWFKTNLKLGQLLLEMNEIEKLHVVIAELLEASKNGESKGAHLMDIYCLQIQLYTKSKDSKMLKKLYNQAKQVQDNVSHPRTIALIEEVRK